jgi:outer membrane biosynthesis protein TonB
VLDSDPPRVFDVTAERALRRWQFEPASRGGIPTQSMGRTRIEFSPG